jgi:proteasome lid subunit RPN8/RPN11
VSKKRKRTNTKPHNDAAALGRTHDVLALTFDTEAHRMLDEHCARDQRREVCGVLAGFCGESNGQLWTRVVAVIEGKHAREEQMSVTFTHETWDVVHKALSARRDGARVVGWYHTHPDFGVFFSSHDVFVHRNFFGTDAQVGVVVDPVRKQRGVFVSRTGRIVTLDRYEVARPNTSGHHVSCEYIPEPLRELMPEAMAAGSSDTSRLDAIEANIAVVGDRTRMILRILCLLMPAAAVLGLVCGYLLGGSFGRGGSGATGGRGTPVFVVPAPSGGMPPGSGAPRVAPPASAPPIIPPPESSNDPAQPQPIEQPIPPPLTVRGGGGSGSYSDPATTPKEN